MNGKVGDELRAHATERLVVAADVFLDALLIFIVMVVNWGVARLVAHFDPDGLDLVVTISLQVIFALATIGGVSAYAARDILVAWKRVWKRHGDDE